MGFIEISNRDLLIGKVVPPAWYRVRVEDVSESLASSGTSTNHTIDATILNNADNGSTKDIEGTPVRWMFNSKAAGFVAPFLAAIQNVKLDDITPGRYDLDAAKGLEVEVFIANKTYNNRLMNDVQHQYRPAKK